MKLFNLGNICDCLTTIVGLSLGAVETNPIIAYGFATFGPLLTYLFKLAFGAWAIARLTRRGHKKTVTFLSVLIWLVVLNNLIHIGLLL